MERPVIVLKRHTTSLVPIGRPPTKTLPPDSGRNIPQGIYGAARSAAPAPPRPAIGRTPDAFQVNLVLGADASRAPGDDDGVSRLEGVLGHALAAQPTWIAPLRRERLLAAVPIATGKDQN